MIVLHFAEYVSGGVATYLKDLISYQCNQENVEAVYLIASTEKSDSELLHMSYPKYHVITYNYRRGTTGVLKILSMSKLIRKMNPDIVHLHSSFAGIVRIKFLFSNFKKCVIYCSHGWSFNRDIRPWKKTLYKLIEVILSYGCQRIINISDYEASTSVFLNSKKMVTIHNAIPKRRVIPVGTYIQKTD